MSTVTVSDTPFVGSDRLLVGIVLSVLTFWLFAQSVINVVPAMKSSLDISLETLTLAVSLSALFSGCFVVASGGLADKFGRMRMTTLGLGLSIVGSAMLVGALAAGAVFIRNGMRKGEAALIDFALFRNRAYGAAVLSNFLLNGAIGTMMIASIWLQQGHHLTPLESGMMTLGYLVTVLAMIRVGEKLLQRYGARLPMMAGPVLTAIAIGLISCTFLDKALYIGVVFASNVLFGLGLGCYATPSTDTAVANAPENKIGVASGIYKMGSSLGGAMGIAVTASLFALFLPLGMAHAAQYALWFNAVLCLGAMAVSALLLPRASHS
ncbi:MFS transporter [Klebsiella variicola]|uniref:MFS transporter n=1 Tax=Klebsiella variicola TaxID=244366 RepID=UPI001033ED59|nr:MFS transporter [Klebsiella variicola]